MKKLAEKIIRFEEVMKEYNGQRVLKDISFTLEKGKFYTLLGPSGCGKSTILNMIAGFTQPSSGEITLDGRLVNEIPAHKRKVNTVFQDYALFPHMNVFENVAFGLKMKKTPKAEMKERVLAALDLVRLKDFANRAISEMSGGQKQRVAIARALVNEPEVLLLDEPLSALDLKLRTDMQYELSELQKRLGITFLFVTHDQEEALAMSDEIFVMKEGEIVQKGSPIAIYDEPLNRYVANFIGESNIVEGTMLADYLVRFNGHEFACVDGGIPSNEVVDVIIRPEDIEITAPAQGKFTAEVDTQLFRGVHYEIILYDEAGNEWMVHSTKKAKEGTIVGLDFEQESIHIMRKDEEEEAFYKRLEKYTVPMKGE